MERKGFIVGGGEHRPLDQQRLVLAAENFDDDIGVDKDFHLRLRFFGRSVCAFCECRFLSFMSLRSCQSPTMASMAARRSSGFPIICRGALRTSRRRSGIEPGVEVKRIPEIFVEIELSPSHMYSIHPNKPSERRLFDELLYKWVL